MKPQSPPATAPASIIAGMTTIAGVPAAGSARGRSRWRPGAEQELTLRADVPEPHPERERAGEAVRMSRVALTIVSEMLDTPKAAPTMCARERIGSPPTAR
jgi:hypothetical protein